MTLAVRPDLLVFDLDGVLVDSETLASEVVAEELTRQGAEITADEVARRFAGYTDSALAAVVSEERGIEIGKDFAEKVAQGAIARIRAGDLPAMPGALEVLAALDGWRRCVASNSARARIDAALAATGLDRFFAADRRFSSQQVARPKPAPDLHLMAASNLGVEPGRCLVIEDSPTGVAAAVAAGMQVVGFVGASHVPADHGVQLTRHGALAVLGDLRELEPMLSAA